MGCQGLLEDIPGRTRKDSKSYPVLSPGESRTFPRTGSSKKYNLSLKERSSKLLLYFNYINNSTFIVCGTSPCWQVMILTE